MLKNGLQNKENLMITLYNYAKKNVIKFKTKYMQSMTGLLTRKRGLKSISFPMGLTISLFSKPEVVIKCTCMRSMVFAEGGKPENSKKKNFEARNQQQTTKNSTHIGRRVWESNPGHISGRRTYSHHFAIPARPMSLSVSTS